MPHARRIGTPARLSIVAALAAVTIGCREAAPPVAAPVRTMEFEATAYSIEGRTAAGTRSRQGIVAADPKVLPLGTRIRVHGAGRYSGDYLVGDTGRGIKGREIDV